MSEMSNRSATARRPRTRTASTGARMEDVARIAGVSMITVSRALREPGKLAAPTLARVEAAIRQTGYVPNLTAGSLASNRSRIIGAVVPTIDNSIFAGTVRGLSEVLEAAGYQLLLGQTGYRENAEEALVTAFLGRRVDGIVLTGVSHAAATIKRLRAARVPVVETWDLTDKPIDMLAGFSNHDAGGAMADYLCMRGYRRLAFAGGDDDRSLARYAGFEAAIRGFKGVRLEGVELAAGTSFRDGREALARLLGDVRNLDAVFFGNDALAIGAMMECLRRNIRVPQDLAIAGFADLDIAAESVPALTTVHVGTRLIGEVAAQLLLSRLTGGGRGKQVRDLGFSISARDSA